MNRREALRRIAYGSVGFVISACAPELPGGKVATPTPEAFTIQYEYEGAGINFYLPNGESNPESKGYCEYLIPANLIVPGDTEPFMVPIESEENDFRLLSLIQWQESGFIVGSQIGKMSEAVSRHERTYVLQGVDFSVQNKYKVEWENFHLTVGFWNGEVMTSQKL